MIRYVFSAGSVLDAQCFGLLKLKWKTGMLWFYSGRFLDPTLKKDAAKPALPMPVPS